MGDYLTPHLHPNLLRVGSVMYAPCFVTDLDVIDLF